MFTCIYILNVVLRNCDRIATLASEFKLTKNILPTQNFAGNGIKNSVNH